MATKTPKNGPAKGTGRAIKDLGPGTADVVRRASEVLESELAAGLAAARKAEARFRTERRVEAGDFQEALTRFRSDGHELVSLARGLTSELRSQSTDALVQRLFGDADQALDLALSLVEMAPELINRVVRMTGTEKGQETHGEDGARPKAESRRRAGGGRGKVR
jgi:hypothetical protein